MTVDHKHLFKGIFLVAGTSIGGGMLALPVLTSVTGFIPSLVVYFLCWAFMASTGLLFLEISLWLKPDANLISMAGYTLGTCGKAAAWLLYLFLFYCLTLAYIIGCGDLLIQLFQGAIPEWMGALIFVLLFAPLVFAGARVVGRINLILMGGLAISYLAFVVLGYRHVKPELLLNHNWLLISSAFPIAFTAFAYQGIIPTLVTYMERNVQAIRKTILIGSVIPLIVYILWQGLILGIVPFEGPQGLKETLDKGQNAVYPLKSFLETPYVYAIGQFLAFFALVTSFFGVTLGMLDFLADGLDIKKTFFGKLFLCFLIFVPPLVIAHTHPGLFLIALDYAGGFGCALLLGLLPILMVWSGRYFSHLKSHYKLPGGRLTLSIMLLFVIFEIICQIRMMI